MELTQKTIPELISLVNNSERIGDLSLIPSITKMLVEKKKQFASDYSYFYSENLEKITWRVEDNKTCNLYYQQLVFDINIRLKKILSNRKSIFSHNTVYVHRYPSSLKGIKCVVGGLDIKYYQYVDNFNKIVTVYWEFIN